jgi:inner membrane protein
MTEPSSIPEPAATTDRPLFDGAMLIPKIVVIAGLALATLLPSYFVSALVAERETRQEAVQNEFTRNWGPQQQLYTPTLVVPYQSAPERTREYLKIAPERLNVVANLAPQDRRRGLFHAIVYDAKVEMKGSFAIPAESRWRNLLSGKDTRVLWDESFIAFGTTTSLTGLRSGDHITVDGSPTSWQPCLEAVRYPVDCKGASLVLANAPVAPGAATIAFQLAVSLRGTSSFHVLYVGKDLDTTIRSPWRTPSFGGNVLPVDSNVTADGFDAHWQIAGFGSPPISTSGIIVDPATLKSAAIGVDLIEATPIYRMITRVAKYGLLFVVLSFAVYFFFELLSRLQIHVLQYALLGVSLSLFSLLLLSLSEPIGYTAGYVVSAALVLAQSSLYTAAIARRLVPTLVFAGMQASLFVFIYVLLDLESYSLLIGTLALFIVVSALMVLTQKVNWLGAVGGWQQLVFMK